MSLCEELRRRLIASAAAPPLAELLHRLYDLTDIFVLLVSDSDGHGLRDHRAVPGALGAGNADEGLWRCTIAYTSRRSSVTARLLYAALCLRRANCRRDLPCEMNPPLLLTCGDKSPHTVKSGDDAGPASA
jgi:hypothetical protein